MKKLYSLFLLLLVIGCNTSEINNEQTKFENTPKAFKPTITVNELFNIQNAILKEYNQKYSNKNNYLSDVIISLDSITLSNTAFQKLKIVNYSLPTVTEIETLINNPVYFYDNVNVSAHCKYALDLLVADEINLDDLDDYITTNNINQYETDLLFYVAYNLKNSNEDNNNWRKKRTIFIVNGYLKQPALGVFQASLDEILNN